MSDVRCKMSKHYQFKNTTSEHTGSLNWQNFCSLLFSTNLITFLIQKKKISKRENRVYYLEKRIKKRVHEFFTLNIARFARFINICESMYFHPSETTIQSLHWNVVKFLWRMYISCLYSCKIG